ncbi:MAG TPA: hypothetical protein VIK91_00325 [Nannocystis sp.]
MTRLRNVFGVTSCALAGFLVGCFAEDAGECSAGAPCPNRGEACDEFTKTCEPQMLSVDGTGPSPAPAAFTETLPFFRGRVCVATDVKPGDKIPVRIEMCHHKCVTPTQHKYKSQYRCTGSSCESALIGYLPDAPGADCPPDVFGKFAQADCVTRVIDATVGPFSIASTGAITGTGTLELPFLSNEDLKEVINAGTVDEVWQIIYRYPQDSERVFQLTMNPNNPSAPANCSDDISKCKCKEIGF